MCRIAGIAQYNSTSEPNAKAFVEAMCHLQYHGGPDDGGVFSNNENTVHLGNRRLSLLDLSSLGHQPMLKHQRFAITYNGELYNFKQIRDELIVQGKQFVSNTDTEVIIEAFATWGTNAFEKFDGMFAFALLDLQTNELYLVRDAVGIKPLYYAIVNNVLYFASEVKAFAPVEALQESLPEHKVLQLAYGFIPEPFTTLKLVKALPKGCFLNFNVAEQKYNIKSFKFFSSFTNNKAAASDFTQNIKQQLTQSVTSQLLADAPVGVFLSGGLDSSILATVASQKIGENLHSLSIYFEDEKFSEKKYQDEVIKKIKGKHTSILLTETEFTKNFESILNDMDMPSCDGINTWFISKYAKQAGLKAVLSGIGADELFGGYPSFSRVSKALAWKKALPKLLTRQNWYPNNYARLRYLSIDGINGIYLFLRGHFTADEIAKQLNCSEEYVWETLTTMPNKADAFNLDSKQLASYLEFNVYMQNQLLKDADVMSMKNSIELRVPFLSNDIISYSFNADSATKFKGAYKKQVLIDAFKNDLPESIWNRPKMGFSFPFQNWLQNNKILEQRLADKNEYAQSLLKDFNKGKVHWSKILNVCLLSN
jgi:asparagine synthase (glutamine-hydrolysing)